MKRNSTTGWVLLITLVLVSQTSASWAQQTGALQPPALPPAAGTLERTVQSASPEAAGLTVLGTPEIFCPEPTKSFGVLYVSEEWKHSFVVTNKGTADLIINNVTKDCGCTSASADAKQLTPGQSTNINVAFNSGQHPTKTKKKVTVLSNDPVNPKLALEFVGEVTSAFRFSPPTFPPFGAMTKGASSERSIDIFVAVKEPVELTGVEGPSPLVQKSLIKIADEPERHYRLTVRLEIPEDFPERFVRDDIIVKTTFEREKELRFAIYAGIEPEVSLTPSFMNFHSVQKSQHPSRTVYIQSRRNKDFQITGIEHSLAGMEIEAASESLGPEGGTRYKITAKMTDEFSQEGFFRDQVLLRTNLKSQPEIQLFVYGSLLAQQGVGMQPPLPQAVAPPPVQNTVEQPEQHAE
ncbi:MAG TPA: DUF1573 domain-containing protein [bacterium]|nr:DUF1573 domain-containing protein [bacterium]